MKKLGKVWTFIVYLFLYAPMIVLFVGSFNDGKDLSEFEGFTFNNYANLFRDSHVIGLLLNSIILGLCSAVVATVLGTLAALGIHAMRGRVRRLVMTLTNIPLVNPEIVTGVSLSLLFVFIGRNMLHTENILGFGTLLIAHVTFNLPYVILSVMPKLRQMDGQLMDAAQDLGWHAAAGLLQGRAAGAVAGHNFRRHHGLYHEPGRLRHKLLRLQPEVRHSARRDIYIYQKADTAHVLLDVHPALFPDTRGYDRHEYNPGAGSEESQ